jgi:uncharacterized protein
MLDLHTEPTGLPQPAARLEPVAPRERISSVDMLRGFALLGILLINILSFGLPANAEEDPTVAGGDTGLNLAVFLFMSVLFEGKMRAIFSMLFGAGVILLTAQAEKRGDQARLADIYYRRTLWLLVIGVLHAYFLWDGDILYGYAISALFLYPFRKVSPPWLILAGLLLLAVLTPKALIESREIDDLRNKAAQADEAARAGATLTKEQEDAQKAWADKRQELKPSVEEVNKEIEDHKKGYWHLFERREGDVVRGESLFLYQLEFWDATGMMLIGMALMQMGIFSASRSVRYYRNLMAIAYPVGLLLNGASAWSAWSHNFDPADMWANGGVLYQPGRLAMGLGHVGLLLWIFKTGRLRWLTARFAAVGQMALTNYLSHTIICTTLFNGYGLGWFGDLERYQLYGVVFVIWIAQLLISPLWLRYFRFGPMEWVWRSLTYWSLQPMRLRVPPTPPAEPVATPAVLPASPSTAVKEASP